MCTSQLPVSLVCSVNYLPGDGCFAGWLRTSCSSYLDTPPSCLTIKQYHEVPGMWCPHNSLRNTGVSRQWHQDNHCLNDQGQGIPPRVAQPCSAFLWSHVLFRLENALEPFCFMRQMLLFSNSHFKTQMRSFSAKTSSVWKDSIFPLLLCSVHP